MGLIMGLNLSKVSEWLGQLLLERTARLTKAEWTRQQVVDAMKPWGWTEAKDPGGSHPLMMVHPHFPRGVPFQSDKTMYNDAYRKHHLAQAGLKMFSDGTVGPIPGHEFYKTYKMHGYLPGPLEFGELHPTSVRTWHPKEPGIKYVNINSIQEGDYSDPKEANAAIPHMRPNSTTLPAVQAMELEPGVYGSLNNHHLLAIARKAGMTHVPVALTG